MTKMNYSNPHREPSFSDKDKMARSAPVQSHERIKYNRPRYKKIDCQEVTVLRIEQDKDSYVKAKLRIVIYDKKYMVLEKRAFYLDPTNSQEKPGKTRSLNFEDVSTIIDKRTEINNTFLGFNHGCI